VGVSGNENQALLSGLGPAVHGYVVLFAQLPIFGGCVAAIFGEALQWLPYIYVNDLRNRILNGLPDA